VAAKSRHNAASFAFNMAKRAAEAADFPIFEVYASMLLGTEGDFNCFATH
jgi:hypothetical protein